MTAQASSAAEVALEPTSLARGQGSFWEVLGVAFRLGISCFGRPIAHLGDFREAYGHRRRWVDETTYADLIALFQFLPGPTSSELGIGIGILRAGKLGGLAAWLGFTLPSAIALVLFVYGVERYNLFRQHPAFQRALSGMNAAVVGILLAALYLTIWTATVRQPLDFAIALVRSRFSRSRSGHLGRSCWLARLLARLWAGCSNGTMPPIHAGACRQKAISFEAIASNDRGGTTHV